MNIIAIDPSIVACGVAMWHREKIHLTTIRPIKTGSMSCRCNDLLELLDCWIGSRPGGMAFLRMDLAIVEIPTFQDSERGKTAAVSGGLIKLSFAAGAIATNLVSRVETVREVTPSQWKGCLTKEQTTIRLMHHKILGPQLQGKKFDHNASDAAAMIMWELDRRPKVSFKGAKEVYCG